MVPEFSAPLRGAPRLLARLRALPPAAWGFVALTYLLPVPAAHAQTAGSVHTATLSYVCTTSSGHTISGDLPPPECKDREVRVLNPDGSVKQVIPAPLTREGRKKREEEESKRRQEEESERKQTQQDRSLLEAYGSVEEIDAARDRAIAGQQSLIERANSRLKQYEREKKRLDDEAEFYTKHEQPAQLKEQFETNAALTRQQEKARAAAEHEIEQIKDQFNARKKRYLELEQMAAEAAAARERNEREAQ